MTTKRKVGQPRKPPEERRDVRTVLMLSGAERAALERFAKARGIGLSAAVRMALLTATRAA